MKKVKDGLVTVYKIIATVSFSVMLISAAVQVFCRYVLGNSPMWTEELARYMFITASMAAAVVALDLGSHMVVDLVTSKLKGNVKVVMEVLSLLLIMVFCLVTSRLGIELCQKTMSQPSPAMHIPMGLVYATIPMGCIGMLVIALEQLLEKILPRYRQKPAEER
ncbi:MAG: TRAP transporter small permease [Oscillospiraceae bacterium]|nr:TRAP transporter small permease [Oscillospiraceae bacterium]